MGPRDSLRNVRAAFFRSDRIAGSFAALVLTAFCPDARAQETAERILEQIDLSPLQKAARDIPLKETVLSLLRAETDAAEILRSILPIGTIAEELPELLVRILIPVGIWSIAAMLPAERAERGAGAICACMLASVLVHMLNGVCGSALQAAKNIAALCENAAPVLATLLSASGAVGSSALMSPAASMAATLCTGVICRITIPAIACAGVIAICSVFSHRFGFAGVRRWITGLCAWTHAGMIGLFTGLLSMRGMIKTGMDSISLQTARYTVDSLLPVVGGDVAGTLGLVIASARTLQSCIGVVCCAVLLSICARPLFLCMVHFLLVRLCCALVQPLALNRAEEILNGFSEVFLAMLVAVVCAAMLFILLLGSSAAMSAVIFA